MTIDLSQFIQVFFEETAEHLASMESLLLALDTQAPEAEDLNAIFRAAHSIKGGAATFGFSDLTDVTHILENQLDRVRKGSMKLRPDMVDVFLEAGDALASMLHAHQSGAEVEECIANAVCLKLQQLEHAPPSSRSYQLEILPEMAFSSGMSHIAEALGAAGWVAIAGNEHWRGAFDSTPADLSEGLAFLLPAGMYQLLEPDAGIAETTSLLLPEPKATSDDDFGFGFFEPLPDAIPQDVFEEGDGFGLFMPLPVVTANLDVVVEGDGFGLFAPLPGNASSASSAQSLPSVPKPVSSDKSRSAANVAGDNASIRVSVEKVDQIINLVGELVITQAMLAQASGQLDPALHEKLHVGIAMLERNTRELQESAMSIRMMPISSVFSRFPRVVRDTAAKLGKKVRLITHGENTELDRGLIERLADPLTHLVRNSLDHGIESAEVRLQKGKDEQGTLTLKAFHQGGNIIIQVLDDGGGLNREKILAKAKSQGMPVSDNMSDAEVWPLIFEAGFSTAEVVTDVSGRGVGMDVVRRNILEMGGRIDIDSVRDAGTTMTIRLPLTLAILDGMGISVSGEVYVVPLAFIVESLQPHPDDIKTISGRGQVVHVRGEYLPVITLNEVLCRRRSVTHVKQGLFVILESENGKAAMLVDDLLGQSQVVIKSLETNYKKIPGISGATIMGDGRVALIIDVESLVKLSQSSVLVE